MLGKIHNSSRERRETRETRDVRSTPQTKSRETLARPPATCIAPFRLRLLKSCSEACSPIPAHVLQISAPLQRLHTARRSPSRTRRARPGYTQDTSWTSARMPNATRRSEWSMVDARACNRENEASVSSPDPRPMPSSHRKYGVRARVHVFIGGGCPSYCHCLATATRPFALHPRSSEGLKGDGREPPIPTAMLEQHAQHRVRQRVLVVR